MSLPGLKDVLEIGLHKGLTAIGRRVANGIQSAKKEIQAEKLPPAQIGETTGEPSEPEAPPSEPEAPPSRKPEGSSP